MDGLIVNAVFALQDMLSGGLARINKMLGEAGAQAAGLSAGMGRLALSMAPVAIAAGALLLVFGMATGKAIAFESAMADVGKVVNFDTQEDFKGMSDAILEMSGRIPMAADGIAAIVANAAQSGVARKDLLEFTEQAAKMGVAFDLTGDQAGKMMADWRSGMNLSLPRTYALADAVNHLSNNMNATAPALGEVIQRVGAVGTSCGLTEIQVAALGGAFLSAGASPEIASTALRKFTSTLTKGSALSKDAAAAFQSLGFSSTQMAKDMQTNAQGTIFKVLESLAAKPKELQMSLLTEMFGEEALGAIAPLLSNMGNLTKAFGLVGDSSAYAGSMQAEFDVRSKTTANTVQLLSNKWDALCIAIGNAFLPAINTATELVSDLTDRLRKLFGTPAGQWFLRMAATLSTAVIGITAFAGAMWGLGAAVPFVAKGFTLIKAALLGLGAPFWIIIGACTLLYLAYKNNFGGIADMLDRWWRNVSLVVQGVMAVFETLKGGVGEIRGTLAEEIEAAGLVGVITTLSKVVTRFAWMFKAAWMKVQEHFTGVQERLSAVFNRIGAAFTGIGGLVDKAMASLFGTRVTSGVNQWYSAGEVIGNVLNGLMDVGVFIIENFVRSLAMLCSGVAGVAALFRGDFAGAAEYGRQILASLGEMFSSVLDLLPFGLGADLRGILDSALGFISDFSLLESGKKIIGTLIDGILSMKDALVSSVSEAFSAVREYLPFSDAKKGPFSDLTASGSAILGTLGQGVSTSAGDFVGQVAGVFDKVTAFFGFDEGEGAPGKGLFGAGGALGPAPSPAFAGAGEAFGPAPSPAFAGAGTGALPPPATTEGRGITAGKGKNKGIHIENLNVTLPDVKDGQAFADSLKGFLEQYDAD